MTGRSLRASLQGIQLLRQALTQKQWKQTNLMGEVCSSRSTVSKFFNGKPVDSTTFVGLCDKLGLDWQQIVDLPKEGQHKTAEQNQNTSIDIDALVQELRQKIHTDIQQRCGTMRVLDMSQPIGLNDIYTNVNILEKIIGRRRKEISELLQECNVDDFERFGLGTIKEERVPGLEAVEKYTKLMILGKPGAGKTTFLKYVAIQCNQGKFQASRVPIFITLKDFAEAAGKPGLLEYISQQFFSCEGVRARHAVPLQEIINHGRALVLLDGLDEVREGDSHRILKEIRELSEQFRDNHFVMTCRIAAREYTFEKFTEVEVADFDDEQIATFTNNWFKDKTVKPKDFLERLKGNNRIRELATNPLLLTLLCLVFEESGDFPANRSELYKEGLDALLKKWDAKRGIYRDQVYKKLSAQRKEELLSKIALATFERGDYFFKQKTAEQYITQYIRNLPGASTEEEVLQLDSEGVLRSIEAQHGLLVERAKGIYSFSHLTFHEYFTAREIVFGTQLLEETLLQLVSYITETQWREVFLLTVGMLPNADRLLLLMKQQLDAILADVELQYFLIWIYQKSSSVSGFYKPVTLRVFYLCLEYIYSFGIVCFDEPIELGEAFNLYHINYIYDLPVSDTCGLDKQCRELLEYQYYDDFFPNEALDNDIDMILDNKLDPNLRQALQELKNELPNSNQDRQRFQEAWQANRQTWCEKLKAVMIKHQNIGHNWQFSNEQKELLRHYYNVNQLLVECLNSDCYVSREVRQEIEDTLLLPIAEIERRKQNP